MFYPGGAPDAFDPSFGSRYSCDFNSLRSRRQRLLYTNGELGRNRIPKNKACQERIIRGYYS